MVREGRMGELTDYLSDIKEELFDAGLSQEDYNDAVDFIGLLLDEED